MTDRRKVSSVTVTYEDGTVDAYNNVDALFVKEVNYTGDKGKDRLEYDRYEIRWGGAKRPVTRAD